MAVEARCSQMWDHTAAQLNLLAKVHHDRKRGRPPRIEDFHPYLRSRPGRRGGGVDRDRWIAAVLNSGGR
jgi:hypothetical protein